jgi:hypothetical protein
MVNTVINEAKTDVNVEFQQFSPNPRFYT